MPELRSMRRLVAAVAACVAAAVPAVLPAQYLQPNAIIETFAAPLTSGPYNTLRISLFGLNSPTTAQYAVYAWNGSDLSGAPLFTLPALPAFTGNLSFTATIPNGLPGQLFAFATFGAGVNVASGTTQGGQVYSCSSVAGCSSFTNGAAHLDRFTVTFDQVTPTVTPEPATVALTAAGLVALGAAVRRRRTA